MFITIIFMVMHLCAHVSGQTEEFEQECNILQTLETLTARVQQQQELLHQFETRDREQETEISILRKQISELTRPVTSATYVRWGRTTCPGNGSELVYSGYAGGSHFSHSGAAVDYLCLPTDPIFAYYEDENQGTAYVYGAEYAMPYMHRYESKFFPELNPGDSLKEKHAPCALCKTTRSTVLMVPARNTCHEGWTLEYNGYLSAGLYSNAAASQYVCLDGKPEYLEADDTAIDNGILFYFVESRCGSLSCPPYTEGRELTCAVCTV